MLGRALGAEPKTCGHARRLSSGVRSFCDGIGGVRGEEKDRGGRTAAGVRRAQGCGIVEFERPEEAANAITHLHLSEVSAAAQKH